MQGEGQEFESPRLHHLLVNQRSGGSDPAQGSTSPITEDSGWTPGRPKPQGAVLRTAPRQVLEPSLCPPLVPLIRDLRPELTDQRTAGSPARQRTGRPPRGQHLDNWNCCSAVNRSSISPSQDKDTIPIDPVRDWPPGQMLEGVKLQRARGGCLGAKSR